MDSSRGSVGQLADGCQALALGDGRGRIYIVEPIGPIMDNPNLTDKRYPGNPTKSYP